MSTDYFGWQSERQGTGKPLPRAAEPNTTAPSQEDAGTATRGGGVEVQEHHASTTIIERLYAVLGKRG